MTDHNRSRAVKEASTLGVGVLLVAALLILVNYFGWKYHKRMDWTASEIYSLSEKTGNVLGQLDRDVVAVMYMEPTDELYQPVRELLARYEAASPRFSVREVDPARNLAEAEELVARYQIDALNVVVFDADGERQIVEANDLAEYDYSGMQFGQAPQMTGFSGEQKFTSALLSLTQAERPKVVFTTGHGELSLTDFSPAGLSGAQELLERDNFDVESWASLGAEAVPDGVALVVVAGPTGNFLPPEIDLLESFVQQGGRVLVMLDPTLSPTGGLVETGLEAWLAGYGIEVGADIVVDPANPMPFFGPDTIYVNSYGSHPITRSLSQAQLPAILSLTRSVGVGDDEIEGYELTTLVETSGEGWGETDLANLTAVEQGEDDVAGPVSLGVAVEAAAPTGDTGETGAAEEGRAEEEPGVEEEAADESPGDRLRLAAFGDATFATNAQLQNVGNLTLFANTLNWLAEREALVAIPPKTPESVRLNMTAAQIRGVFWFVVLGLPLLVVAAGIWVHQRRKR